MRPDRDDHVQVLAENVLPSAVARFDRMDAGEVLEIGKYDYRSVMHPPRDQWAKEAGLDTLDPVEGQEAFLDVMGTAEALSLQDRDAVVRLYGPGPESMHVVSNTEDSGFGSLRQALFTALQTSGTTISFAIPQTDRHFEASDGTYIIRLRTRLPVLGNGVIIDGGSQAW